MPTTKRFNMSAAATAFSTADSHSVSLVRSIAKMTDQQIQTLIQSIRTLQKTEQEVLNWALTNDEDPMSVQFTGPQGEQPFLRVADGFLRNGADGKATNVTAYKTVSARYRKA